MQGSKYRNGFSKILSAGIYPLFYVWIIAVLSGCTESESRFDSESQKSAYWKYPSIWWRPVLGENVSDWEILPQDAGPGEVILSKRNELGLLSNFADTPFTFRGKRYASVEGFWQMLKYPEGDNDPRWEYPGVTWNYTRQDVSQMIGFEAKRAGKLASANMEVMGINWVSFEGRRLTYRTSRKGKHYDLIAAVTAAKVQQNPEVKGLLLATGDLILRPDHKQDPDAPPAWRYCEILMKIRNALRENKNPLNDSGISINVELLFRWGEEL